MCIRDRYSEGSGTRSKLHDGRIDKHSAQPIEEELEEAIDVLNRPGLEELTPGVPLRTIHEQPVKESQLSQRDQEETKERFVDTGGDKFDPREKFGTLEKDYTEYDPHMTKYEAVLPENFYMKTIEKQSPEKRDKWFVRPHHVETLTRHPYSKWDNVLNTKYYSYYQKQKEEKERGMAKEVIDSLEEQIIKLKARVYLDEQLNRHKEELGMGGRSLSLKSRKDKDVLGKVEASVDEIRRYVFGHSYRVLNDSSYKINKEKVVMDAYEGILYALRRRERELLNLKRSAEYEKHRPSADNWYALKTPEFTDELIKNRIAVRVSSSY
eukprot:TRINITY_DN12080_c0_g2_i1.p1 TRINITY_DN12080_c0_g2~~TRINITY_DN12080_c0_g2_i1.p1  ORF type:complete len:324 (-),score=87.71 TRINITY_DN12080_c0_g2_i1:91-1062(-)